MPHQRGEEALVELRTAADLDPLSPVIQSTLPEYYYLRRDYDRAISDYNQALKINPNYALAYYDRGVVYYDRHDYEKAAADLSKAIQGDITLQAVADLAR